MSNIKNKCFVCGKKITPESELNKEINLRVCLACKGTKEEKQKVEEYLDSLADDLVCGCI